MEEKDITLVDNFSKEDSVLKDQTRRTVGVINDMTHDKLSEEEIIENHEYLDPPRARKKKTRTKKKHEKVLSTPQNSYGKYLSVPSSNKAIFTASTLQRRKRRSAIIIIVVLIIIIALIYYFA